MGSWPPTFKSSDRGRLSESSKWKEKSSHLHPRYSFTRPGFPQSDTWSLSSLLSRLSLAHSAKVQLKITERPKPGSRETQTVLQGYRNLTTWCWPFTSLDLSLLIWHIKGLSLGLQIIKKDLNVLFVMNCESAFSRLAQCHQKAKFSYDINIQGNDNPEYQTFTVMLGDTRAWPWTVLHVSVHP